jgi:hypothetical protein
LKTFNKNAQEKRKKELGRQQWQKEKAERLARRQQEREKRGQLGPDEDPDIAGIVPGPQPTATPEGPEAPSEEPKPEEQST